MLDFEPSIATKNEAWSYQTNDQVTILCWKKYESFTPSKWSRYITTKSLEINEKYPSWTNETPKIAWHACKHQSEEHNKSPANVEHKSKYFQKKFTFQEQMIIRFFFPTTTRAHQRSWMNTMLLWYSLFII